MGSCLLTQEGQLTTKDEERKAAIERGEYPGRGGRGGSRGRGGRANNPAAMAEDWGREPVERDYDITRGRGRGRGRGNERGRGGRGGHQSGQTRGQDEGWGRRPAPEAAAVAVTEPLHKVADDTETTGRKAAISAVGDYVSSEETSSGSEMSVTDSSSDTSDPSESENEDEEMVEPVQKQIKDTQPDRPVCKNFARTGKCKWGDKCHFSHKVS